MLYDDPIHGRVTITEPVLLAVMQSAAIQRLHGVLQHGITAVLGITEPITRFEHSVGAMLVVRRLGGTVEEQLGALLHDVSHTAFSHVMDHVFDNAAKQSFHDDVKEDYVKQSDLPALLAQFGYDWRDFLDETQFPLLEQPAPALCADRLDYFLRDAQGLKLCTAAETTAVWTHLTVHDGRLMVTDIETARWLGRTFMAADDASWANFWEVGLYEVTAVAIRHGLAIGAITEADVWLTDTAVWQKLQAHPDPDLQAQLTLVSPEVQFVWDEANPTFTVNTKIRTIDPDVVMDGIAKPLSQWDAQFGAERAAYLARKAGPWPMRVVGLS